MRAWLKTFLICLAAVIAGSAITVGINKAIDKNDTEDTSTEASVVADDVAL